MRYFEESVSFCCKLFSLLAGSVGQFRGSGMDVVHVWAVVTG